MIVPASVSGRAAASIYFPTIAARLRLNAFFGVIVTQKSTSSCRGAPFGSLLSQRSARSRISIAGSWLPTPKDGSHLALLGAANVTGRFPRPPMRVTDAIFPQCSVGPSPSDRTTILAAVAWNRRSRSLEYAGDSLESPDNRGVGCP
jgi:hypothetical protein